MSAGASPVDPFGTQPGKTIMPTLTPDLVRKMHAWWRAANYLSAGQIYLCANPLLEEPLTLEHIKPRLLGHWGTTPGLNFLYVHLSRLTRAPDLNMINVIGPGHGGPGLQSNLTGAIAARATEIAIDCQLTGSKRMDDLLAFSDANALLSRSGASIELR